MTTTEHLGLTKDAPSEAYDVERVNANSDKIDEFAGETKAHLANQDNPHAVTASQVGVSAEGITAETVQAALLELLGIINTKYIALVSGDDLNTITTAGMYRSASSAITNSLLNVPSIIGNNGFAMEVFSAAIYPTTIQRITWGGYSTFMPNCIMRCGRTVDGARTWGAWYQVAMAEIVEEVSAE